MLDISALRHVILRFVAILAILCAPSSLAARLVPEKTDLAIGETTYVKLESGSAFLVQWSASPELQILASDSDGATVKGIKGGTATLTAKWLSGKKSVKIVVREAAAATAPPASPTLLPYPRLPAADDVPAQPATGGIPSSRESPTGTSAPREVFTALGDLARRDQPLDLAQAREFFRLVQQAAGPNSNVWHTLRAVKRANKANWDAVQQVENQLVALVRDTLVRGRENVLRRGGLGTVFAFLDSGKWRNRATNDLFFDTDFDTTFFADRLADVDPDGRDTVISRIEDMLVQELGVGSRHLGIELTGFGYEAQGDNYVSKSGIKWALRESASHMHLIDPIRGRIGPNIAHHPNVLFARQQEAALRLRHPELFDSSGHLLPNLSRAEVQRRLQAEPGLSRSERMFAEGARMSVTDAALAPIDMACHLSETQQSTHAAEEIAKISKQVARSTAVFIEGMGGGEAGQRVFTPAELEFMRLARQLETAKIERAAAEAQVARFMAEHPADVAYSEAQIAELDRLLEQARTQKAVAEQALAALQGRWSADGVRDTALTVLKKQARAGFAASLHDLLARPPAERSRALGDLAREMEVLARHYQSKGAPAEMLQWVRQGLETSLILQEMSRDARFGELWTAFERMGRTGPREIARLKEFLNGSEAGRRLLARVGVALDNLVNPPETLALAHPMAEAGRSLREIAGGYGALVGHTALLVGLVDSAYQAKTDEEFAVNLAHTLIGTTTVGLILQEGQQLILGGDPKAAARLLAYLLVPETMLPTLVDALGQSTINLGASVAFDTQLDALYLVSKFDQQGALTEIGGYPRGQLAEMLADILDAGGHRVLEEMVNKAVRDSNDLVAEQAKMVNETMKHAVVSALRTTFLVGKQMVFKDDATLSAIVGNVHNYQEEIESLARSFGIEPPLGDTRLGPSAFAATAADFYPDAYDPRTLTALGPKDTRGRTPNVPHWAASLDRGQLRALAQLFVSRDWWGNEARRVFLATLVRTLEERHRAEQDVDANLRDKKRQELMDRFAEIDITEQGTEAYNQEAGYHLVKHVWNVTLGFATPRERAVHEMKALNRYLDVYGHVRDLRFAIEAEITRRTGRAAAPRPLTSMPALTAVPAIDYAAADSLARQIGALGEALSRTLTQIKGAPLEGDYDTGMFARIYEAQYLDLYWSEARKSTAALTQQVAAWKIVAKHDLDALREDCHNQASAASKRAQDLIEEFRRHYAHEAVTADIRISPSDLTEGDRFNAEVVVTQGVVPKGGRWIWEGSDGVQLRGEGRTASGVAKAGGRISARLVDGAGKTLVALTGQITTRPKPATEKPAVGPDGQGPTGQGIDEPKPNFSAALPANWEVQPIENGVKFVRKVAKTKGPCGWDSSVSGSVTATFEAGALDDKALQARIAETQAGLERQQAERKIGCATPDPAVGLFKAGGLEGVAGLALGEFKGGIVDYPNWVRRGSGGWLSGYTPSHMIACGNGAAHGKAGSIEFSYRAGGGGCWDNSDRAYLVRQVLAAQKEARAIIASLRLDGGGMRSEPYEGPRYDGSDNPVVRLLPEKMPKLKVGDLATVEAIVENAEPEDPPYTYDWDGSFHGKAEDLKKRAKVTLHPERPGKYRVGVAVSGQRYGMGYASLEYEVADVQVKVERVPNENTPIPVGGRARFKATVLIDGKPAEGTYIYRWQPNTELVFSATESTAAGETTATFTRLDERQKLWVEVLERKEGRLATVAESERLEIRVIQPKMSLSAEPKEPLVGQETRVTLKDEPRLDDKVAGFRWAHKGDALNPGPTQDERVFTFKPKSLKPVTVTARGYLRDGNADLGEAELAIRPKAYDVKLNAPRARGPQLQVWVCDTQLGQAQKCGMQDIPQGRFATFQDIFIQSAVTPQPPAPRYRWSVDPSGSCGLPGAGSELRLNCSNTGSYTVRLQVTDADNVLLGEAETGVTVSVSDQDVKQAPKSKAAYEKMQQARQKASDGKLDEAIALAGTASTLDPKNTEARDLGNRWRNERDAIGQQLDRARNALAANRPDEAQKELDAAKKLHPNYPPLLEVEKQIADKRKTAGVTTSAAAGAASLPIGLAGVGGKQGTPRLVKGVAIDDSSWIRFKATDENRRSLDIPVPTPTRAEAVAIVSNLDDATYLEQGKTIARIVVGKDSGDEVLEIQAGVHSSEWNYGVGPKHQRVNAADIGDNRFLVVLPFARAGVVERLRVEYVDSNAPKWAGHAPGFVLRGISLVRDTRGLTLTPAGLSASQAAEVDVAGQWRTSEGVMTLTQNGRAVAGNYTNDGGEIVGELSGNVLEGWWIENGANERCATPKNGRHYWGRIRFTFSGDRFTGTWSYCDRPATGNAWTGERIGAAPAVGASLRLDRTTYRPGDSISVHFTAPATWPGDAWVGIVPSRIPHGDELQNDRHDIAFQYLDKRTSGTLTFAAPAAGDWDFRLHDTDRNGKEHASVSFRVDALGEGGRDYTGITPGTAGPSPGYLRIETCVDGSDWIRIDNGRLTHEHRAFDQIGAHPGCPVSHQVAGGGFLVDGQVVSLQQLPRSVGIDGIGRIEVERGRGAVRLDGPNRVLIDDDGPGGADVYIIRLYAGTATSGVGGGRPGGRDYTGPAMGGAPGEFDDPQVDGVALDLCREWGASCGKPAADAFCKRQGYAESIDHRIQYDTPPTRIISSGQVCDASHCDRIVWVKCSGGTPGATPQAGQLIFEVGNIGGVANGPSRPTTFTLTRAHRVTLIRNYHWNGARGAKPGTISLRDAGGRVWGPWPTTGSPGQGGVPNAYWTAHPNVVLPAGSYTVVDSDPASWAHNAESGNRGFVRVEGYPTDAAATPASSAASKPEGVLKEVDELLDALKSLKGLFGE